MSHVGCLRQPGRSRGVDEQRPRIDGRQCAFRHFHRAGRDARKGRREWCEPRDRLAVDPAAQPRREPRPGGNVSRGEIRTDDDQTRLDDADAVGECVPDQMGIQQCDARADPGQAEPDGKVLGAVIHQQAHDVAGHEALRQAKARVLGGAAREIGIAQRCLRRRDCRGCAQLCGLPLDQYRQRQRRFALDRRRTRERADPGLHDRICGFGGWSGHGYVKQLTGAKREP